MLFATIPTAGTRPKTLYPLLESLGLPPERIVIIATRPDVHVPPGHIVIEDLGEINIQRWWTMGINEARKRGATRVAVCNDDLVVSPDTLQQLSQALDASGATIASPARQGLRLGLHTRPLVPYSPVLWGCLWMLDATSDLRPDTGFRWWYGDNDLDIRARRDFQGVVSVDAFYEHTSPGEHTGVSTALQQLAADDSIRYHDRYQRIIWMTHQYQRLQRVFSKFRIPPRSRITAHRSDA